MGNAGSIITEAKSRGNTFFQSKKYRSAVAHYRHALATESGGAEAHLLRRQLHPELSVSRALASESESRVFARAFLIEDHGTASTHNDNAVQRWL